jgi:hypothetical protein
MLGRFPIIVAELELREKGRSEDGRKKADVKRQDLSFGFLLLPSSS